MKYEIRRVCVENEVNYGTMICSGCFTENRAKYVFASTSRLSMCFASRYYNLKDHTLSHSAF